MKTDASLFMCVFVMYLEGRGASVCWLPPLITKTHNGQGLGRLRPGATSPTLWKVDQSLSQLSEMYLLSPSPQAPKGPSFQLAGTQFTLSLRSSPSTEHSAWEGSRTEEQGRRCHLPAKSSLSTVVTNGVTDLLAGS